jgi:hypothetical protein
MAELTVTDAVLSKLAQAMQATGENGAGGPCYRFELDDEGNPQLQVAEPAASDKIYTFDGRHVLAIPPEFASAYAGNTLDINDAGDFLIF